MIVYHEITPSSVSAALRDGLKRTSRGEKGTDPAIARTDHYLDRCCPEDLRQAGVSRDDNLYAYVATDAQLVDITNGNLIPLSSFVNTSQQTVLQLTVNPDDCYVSDLDAYDKVKHALESHDDTLEQLAHTYWHRLRPLRTFSIGDIQRPEVMITRDISPKAITVIE